MPFDPYFQKGWKRKENKRAQMAAKHRLSWPESSKYERRVHLEMRLRGTDDAWFHVINVPKSCAAEEQMAWEEQNPEYEFRSVLTSEVEEPKIEALV